MIDKMDKKALLNVKEMCEYLGIGQTKAREIHSVLSPWILKYSNSCKHDYPISEFMAELLQIYTKRHAEMVEKFKVLW